MARNIVVVSDFAQEARALRSHFEGVFSDPKHAAGERFVWDYWHLPGQYTQLRTPAYHFFPKALYEAFHNRLVWWGRRNLGCHDISPAWLSCYVDGCEQRLHADLPHGPWAFVFSLTPWRGRKFRGGETLLLREEILDYWSNLDRYPGLEEGEIFQEIVPQFGQLTVFDPRIPHGVRRVEGVSDVCAGRLVVHGWFVNPRPFIEGPLARGELVAQIQRWTRDFSAVLADLGEMRGLFSVNFSVSRAGKVSGVRVLSNCLRSLDRRPEDVALVERRVRSLIAGSGFRKQRNVSHVTVPFVFAGAES